MCAECRGRSVVGEEGRDIGWWKGEGMVLGAAAWSRDGESPWRGVWLLLYYAV